MTTTVVRNGRIRKTFWAGSAFYILIGFEFLYMAGPFAAYFYTLYRPGLNFLNESETFSWLTRFFMPHIVAETSSTLIDWHNFIGTILVVLGGMAFCVGAGQVYYHKLAKKGAVTAGVYRLIRHPQYTSFAVCGFGLLLLWPRYIVLVMFITMLFGYYWVAKVEERECQEKYGRPYTDYKNRTHMFLPFAASFLNRLPNLPKFGWRRATAIVLFYVLTLTAAIGTAFVLEFYSLKGLYTYATRDSLTISLVKINPDVLETVVNTAEANKDVHERLLRAGKGTSFLNYVLPTEWFVSEIPMDKFEGAYHHQSRGYNRELFKMIFTRVELRATLRGMNQEILRQVTKRTPLVEVWVNVARHKVMKVKDPPATVMYENIPVAIY